MTRITVKLHALLVEEDQFVMEVGLTDLDSDFRIAITQLENMYDADYSYVKIVGTVEPYNTEFYYLAYSLDELESALMSSIDRAKLLADLADNGCTRLSCESDYVIRFYRNGAMYELFSMDNHTLRLTQAGAFGRIIARDCTMQNALAMVLSNT